MTFPLLLLMALGCAPPSQDAEPSGPRLRLGREPAPLPLVAWSLDPSAWTDAEGNTRNAEWLGRVAVSLEAQLYRGTIPVGPAGPPPAVAETPHTTRYELGLVPHDGDRIEASLCDPNGACEIHFATGAPEAVGTALAEAVLDQIGIPHGVPNCLVRPPSSDDYATLVAGRSAATVYGWYPPSSTPGDPRRDPVARAIFLDPTAATAQWLAGRAAWQEGDVGAAAAHLRIAARGCPEVEGWAADEALALAAADRQGGAFPADDRFVFARIDAELASDRPDAYRGILAAIERWPKDPRLEERAAAAAPEDAIDKHLARWAWLDREAPRPLRKLARRALEAGDWDRLLELCEDLEARGVDTARWRTPALLALGRVEQARDAAPSAVRDLVAARVGAPPTGDRPEELLLKAQQELATNPTGALERCDAVLSARPHWPEALALAADAARAAGGSPEPYLRRLKEVEP